MRHNSRMPSRFAAASLLVSVIARAAALVATTVLALTILLDQNFSDYRPDILAAWLGLAAIPALILTPLIGTLAASRSNKSFRMVGSLLVVAILAWAYWDWSVPLLSVVGWMTLDAAFSSAAYLALAKSYSQTLHWR